MIFSKQLTFLVVLLLAICCTSQKQIPGNQNDTTSIYLVRHAEKIDDSKDPDLSPDGLKRASNLAIRLKDQSIVAVFSTDYKRTKQTAMPLAKSVNLETEIYNPRDNASLIEQLKSLKGGNALVVGHSNSTPALVNQILGMEKYPSLEHEEYDKIFVLDCDIDFSCKSRIETY